MIAFGHFLTISFLGFLLASCSSTKVIDSWSNQGYTGKVKNIFIVGDVNDDWTRILFENALAEKLAEEGIDSRPSHSYSPRFDEIGLETIPEKISSSGCDSIFLARVVGQRTKASFTTKVLANNYSSKFSKGEETDYSLFPRDSLRISSESSGARVTSRPPSSTSFVVQSFELLLYDRQTEKLIWSTLMEIDLGSNRQEMIQKIVEVAVRSLKTEGLI
jgi:hypothetical protein